MENNVIDMEHGKEYFSPSQLKSLYKGADEFQMYLDRKYVANKGMELGTLIHTLILEPDMFDKRYAVFDDDAVIDGILKEMPEEKRAKARPTTSKKYTNAVAEFKKEAGSKTVINKKLYDKAQSIVDKVKFSGVYDSFFTGGEAEVTKTKTVEYVNGVFNALCIIDYDKPHMSVDLKTTSNKDLSKFKYDADAFGYDIQASVTNRINGKPFFIVAVQTVEPYKIGVFECSIHFMQRGNDKVNKALLNYEAWKESDVQIFEGIL